MPRVYTLRANKAYPEHGIAKGDTYYKWSFRYGGELDRIWQPLPGSVQLARLLACVVAGIFFVLFAAWNWGIAPDPSANHQPSPNQMSPTLQDLVASARAQAASAEAAHSEEPQSQPGALGDQP